MKKENILVIVLICMAVAGVLYYQYSDGKNAGFQNSGESIPLVKDGSAIAWENFSDGMASGKNSDKHIFLYFHADWCTYCKKLKKTTFKDKAVLKYLSQNFISIAVDTDKDKALANQWRVTGLPSMWFLGPDGSKISNIPGYVDADLFIKFLKYIHTKSYKTIKFNEFIKTL